MWAAEDHGRARRFAARLLVVLGAARLEQTASAIVEVELMMAALEMADGQPDLAEPRLTSLLGRIDEDRDPGWVAGVEAMVGTIARDAGRRTEAVQRWDRCTLLSVAVGDLAQAASAATSAADAARDTGLTDGEMYRRWLAAAERCAVARPGRRRPRQRDQRRGVRDRAGQGDCCQR